MPAATRSDALCRFAPHDEQRTQGSLAHPREGEATERDTFALHIGDVTTGAEDPTFPLLLLRLD